MEFDEIVKAELLANDIILCVSCDSYSSHSRGFATPDDRTIHYNKKMATRRTLYGFLHEVGHIVFGHGKNCQLRRFEKESQAEEYARESMRMLGFPVPRSQVALGNTYVKRWKRFGDNIKKGRNK